MLKFSIKNSSGTFVDIKTPIEYKPKLATTSTKDSDRAQDLIMHNTPMGTIVGYDMKWGDIKTEEMQTIIKLMVNKPSFRMKQYDNYDGWCTKDFYASNFDVDCVRLKNGEELWSGLSINIRPINPLNGVLA